MPVDICLRTYACGQGFDISNLLAKEHQEIEEVQHWLDEHDPQRLEPATAKYREDIQRLKAGKEIAIKRNHRGAWASPWSA